MEIGDILESFKVEISELCQLLLVSVGEFLH